MKRFYLVWITVLTAVTELICVVLRFGYDLSSSEQTRASIGVLTLGVRIHHSYVGLAMILLCTFWQPKHRHWMLAVGWALLLSDLIHHFLVLWPLTGSPQFDLMYH